MDITEAVLDSWDRQSRIVMAVASRIDESNRNVKPSEDGWPLDHQLAHIHQVRREWLFQVAPERSKGLQSAFTAGRTTPIRDLPTIKRLLDESAAAIREALAEGLRRELVPVGGYDNLVLFLQHMVWHEGWHVGLIFLGLRLAGQEPDEAWEEANVWGEWRVEEWDASSVTA